VPTTPLQLTPPLLISPFSLFFLTTRPPPRSTLFPYTTLFRSNQHTCNLPLQRLGCIPDGHILQIFTLDLAYGPCEIPFPLYAVRSEEHTSELQSRENLVCRLLLEKKKKLKDVQTRLYPLEIHL